MEATYEEEEPKPNDLLITSQMTRHDLEPRPPGGGEPRVDVVLRLAIMECHKWVEIGGRTGRVRRPKRLSRVKSLAMDDYLRNGVDCRRRIGLAIKDSLKDEEEFGFLSRAHWDQAVPRGVKRALAVAVQRGGTWEARLDISVHFEFVYSERKALLRACVEIENGGGDPNERCTGGGDPTGRSGGGDGDAPWCSICFEEMSRGAGEVMDLPGCTHGFHRRCIAKWFHKASTCPVCRCDQLRYLPPDYRDLHDRMTNDPDSLQPDYL